MSVARPVTVTVRDLRSGDVPPDLRGVYWPASEWTECRSHALANSELQASDHLVVIADEPDGVALYGEDFTCDVCAVVIGDVLREADRMVPSR